MIKCCNELTKLGGQCFVSFTYERSVYWGSRRVAIVNWFSASSRACLSTYNAAARAACTSAQNPTKSQLIKKLRWCSLLRQGMQNLYSTWISLQRYGNILHLCNCFISVANFIQSQCSAYSCIVWKCKFLVLLNHLKRDTGISNVKLIFSIFL